MTHTGAVKQLKIALGRIRGQRPRMIFGSILHSGKVQAPKSTQIHVNTHAKCNYLIVSINLHNWPFSDTNFRSNKATVIHSQMYKKLCTCLACVLSGLYVIYVFHTQMKIRVEIVDSLNGKLHN